MKKSQSGFTLVELVAVMILVGVVAAIAIPRLNGSRAFDELGFVNETQAILRYAHKTAIASRRTVCVEFTGTTVSLKITGSAACNTDLGGPAGEVGPYSISARNSGARFDPVPASFNFNGLGRPSHGAMSIVIRDAAGSIVRTITIEQETGYVRS